jgi:hypothetical protein
MRLQFVFGVNGAPQLVLAAVELVPVAKSSAEPTSLHTNRPPIVEDLGEVAAS